MPGTFYEISPEVMARDLGDEVVLLHATSGKYFGLDPVGARVWQLLAAGGSLEAAIEALSFEYDVSVNQLDADLRALAQELAGQGLLLPRSSGSLKNDKPLV
jgi:hypothetical protein